MDLAALEKNLSDKQAPVHLWNPEYCGDIDIFIDRDGRWFHEGGEIKRLSLVRLLSTVLKKEGDTWYLVTPVEKMAIKVAMQPLILIDAELIDGIWVFEAKTGEKVALSDQHPMKIMEHPDGEMYPSIWIRGELYAHFHRNLYYRMAEHCELKTSLKHQQGVDFLLYSNGKNWLFGEAIDS